MKIALQEKLLPGEDLAGKLDFAEEIGVYALRDIGFEGYLAYECRIEGEPRQALCSSVNCIRAILDALH